MPAGERVGSAVVICPVSMKGRAGIALAATWLSASDIWSTESATCTVPGSYGGGVDHGTGASRAQSTLTVEGSSWNFFIALAVRAGTSSSRSRSPYSRGATTSAITACRAVNRSPPSVRTPVARPDSTSIRVTGVEQRISPPIDSIRRASACVSRPAPPSGTGKPTVWPSITSSSPMNPEPAASSGMSACAALPASSSRGDSPPNRLRPSSIAGESAVRMKSRPPTEGSLASAASPERTGGNGDTSALTMWSPIRSHSAHSASHSVAVPGVLLVHQGRGDVAVAVHERPGSVLGQVSHRRGCVHPPQAVLLEAEALDASREAAASG